MWQEYIIPSTLEQALQVLKNSDGKARVIAGGTDLIVQLKEGQKQIQCLVSVMGIHEFCKIKVLEDSIHIGPAVTHREAVINEVIRRFAPALEEACAVIGSPQIRNQGTIVGNVLNAVPTADAAIALCVLGAKVEVQSLEGAKSFSIEDIFEGVNKSKIDSTKQIVSCIKFPIPPQYAGTSFVRISKRKSLSLPMLNGGFYVEIKNQTFINAAIVLAPVGPTPFRAHGAEELLIGANVGTEVLEAAAIKASEESELLDSNIRGSVKVRKSMVKELVIKGLGQAISRVAGAGGI